MRWTLCLFLAFTSLTLAAQSVPPVEVGKQTPPRNIGPFTEFFEDTSGDTLPLSVIQQQRFRPFAQKRNERTTNAEQPLLVTWLRFRIQNTHPTDTIRLFYDCWQGLYINVYENNHQLAHVGVGVVRPKGSPNTSAVLVRIPPGQTYIYYVQSISQVMSVLPIVSLLYTPEAIYRTTLENAYLESPLLVYLSLLTGSLLFMSLFAFYSYWLNRDKAFLYYGLYTLMGFYLTVQHIDDRFGLDLFRLPRLPLALLIVFYAFFMNHLLAIRLQQPRIWPWVKALLGLAFVEIVWTGLEELTGVLFLSNNFLYRFKLLPAWLLLLLITLALIRSQVPIKKYLLVGVATLIVLAFVPQFLNPFVPNLPARIEIFVNNPGFWSLTGVAIESLCFAMALAYRSRLVELENTSLHTHYTQELEKQLTDRTAEIQIQSQRLEEQRIRQLELSFEQKLAETEMTALRAQMNPHFIFNCLNSIKLYATENNAAKASDYLTKFSRLIRLVLENSRSERVTLRNELDALQLYLDMEAMRFKTKLRFAIEVAESIDTEFVEIPPLLLQPYVENAIWHGLMHKLEGGSVQVRVEQPADNRLRIIITDDGIGRAKAAELKSKSAMPQKSFGMNVTSERIALINQLYKTQTHIQLTDLIDPEGHPAGTEVVVEIPI
ncbi:MAG: hypothetical protein BGO59_35060 [Spirosoma sp. 48-14]|nr:MAG: hypothetical protein BGO59_35060 [Spirosoma sp. 48-14]